VTSPPPTQHTARALAASIVVLAAVLGALLLAGPAAAATPCGDKILADWYDNGRIDRLYQPHCYEEAIDGIPSDIRDYADAEEVISRALQLALRGKLGAGGCDPSPDGSKNDCVSGAGGNDGTGGSGGSRGGSSDDPQAAPGVDTSGPSSVPVPLLVLGGLSLALLAAGGLGYLSRRRQAVVADDFSDDDTLV